MRIFLFRDLLVRPIFKIKKTTNFLQVRFEILKGEKLLIIESDPNGKNSDF